MLETLAKSFLNPHHMHCRVLCVRGEQITGSPVSRKGDRRMRNQLFIGELFKQRQRFLACGREMLLQRFHRVIAVGIDVGLIPLV